jgi:hypothetical protein
MWLLGVNPTLTLVANSDGMKLESRRNIRQPLCERIAVHRPPAEALQNHQLQGTGKEIAVFRLLLHTAQNGLFKISMSSIRNLARSRPRAVDAGTFGGEKESLPSAGSQGSCYVLRLSLKASLLPSHWPSSLCP